MGKSTVYSRWGLKHLNFVSSVAWQQDEASHWVVLYSDQVVLGCSCSSSCRSFCSKVSCLPLSATCRGSHRDAEAALEYLNFLDENQPLDGAGVIADDDGSAISLPSDGRLETSGTEGESEAKSSDGKSLTTRVTMAMIRCAFLEVHMEEEMFAEFGDEDHIEDMNDESIEQESPLGKGVGRGRGWAKGGGRGLCRGNAVDGNATIVGNNDAQPLTWDVVNLGESEPRESIILREPDAHFRWYCMREGEFNFCKLFLN